MAAYPHKQTVLILILCILAVGGAAFYAYRGNSAPADVTQALSVIPAPAQQLDNTNWQKQFLALASSSGAYDPAQTASKASDPGDSTATYKFGQEFLTQYILLRQTGLEGDPRTVSTTIDQIIAKGADSIDQPTIYGPERLFTADNSINSIRSYAVVFESVRSGFSSLPDEADLAASAFENGDTSALAKLDPVIASYASMVSRLLSVRVPTSLADDHLKLVNSLSILLYCVTAFRHMDTDPLKGLAAVRLDAIGSQAANAFFAKIEQGLQSK